MLVAFCGRSFSWSSPSLSSSSLSVMFVAYDFLFSSPVLEPDIAWMEHSTGRSRLSHHRELMAMFVVISQYQQLCSDNVTFQEAWEAEVCLRTAIWDATATRVQTQLHYNRCSYVLPPETQKRTFSSEFLLLKIMPHVNADWQCWPHWAIARRRCCFCAELKQVVSLVLVQFHHVFFSPLPLQLI